MEGLATGSNERSELLRVRHGSDSGVGVSHTKKLIFNTLVHSHSMMFNDDLFFFSGSLTFVKKIEFLCMQWKWVMEYFKF